LKIAVFTDNELNFEGKFFYEQTKPLFG